MAWFSGRVSLGNFPDLAGAVTKISESVKNMEKNFDSALGLEEKAEPSGEASGMWPSTDTKTLFTPVMAFMGQRSAEDAAKPAKESEYPEHPSRIENPSGIEDKEVVEPDTSTKGMMEKSVPANEENEDTLIRDIDKPEKVEEMEAATQEDQEVESEPLVQPAELHAHNIEDAEIAETGTDIQQENLEVKSSLSPVEAEVNPKSAEVDQVEGGVSLSDESCSSVDSHDTTTDTAVAEENISQAQSETADEQDGTADTQAGDGIAHPGSPMVSMRETETVGVSSNDDSYSVAVPQESVDIASNENNVNDKSLEVIPQSNAGEIHIKQEHLKSAPEVSGYPDATQELQKVKMEMKMMEAALQGAARQAQAKADEIANMMNENEQLKTLVEDLKRKSNEAEIESLREEYHQRVSTLERKVYALTKERDTLRREQNKKSDAAALLKEKDEIISQVMAEGEELSKKQAAQESTIRKLRAQIRELEEEKKGLTTKLQVEENKVESIKRDKAATEKLLQETIEKHQAEISTQKEFYISALNAAKEAEALAEARANSEARTELESRLKEAEEREAMLVQTLEELRQTLSRKDQQAVFMEDRLRRDIEDLQRRYQESERRCEELISQVPESTRPLLRQIEAIQEAASRKAEAWAAVERSLNSRLQEAEAKAAAAEERERSINERLSQTLSRVNVLEAQISCLRTEQTQLSRSLEKERQRAAENRQEYLVAKEEADTQEGHAGQLEEELRELKRKHKQELQDALIRREHLEQELEKEKTARLELERTAHVHSTVASEPKIKHAVDNGNLSRRLSNASSLGSMEESYFLQASLESSDSFSERRNLSEMNMSAFYMKSMTPSAFESALRQKEGELASYMSRLASMESIRDSLAEELVKMTGQCEKLRSEASMVPGIRAELEALRRRHSAALELMGERDEELEELRADIVDLKEMYREQVSLLVNQIQTLSASMGVAAQ